MVLPSHPRVSTDHTAAARPLEVCTIDHWTDHQVQVYRTDLPGSESHVRVEDERVLQVHQGTEGVEVRIRPVGDSAVCETRSLGLPGTVGMYLLDRVPTSSLVVVSMSRA